MVKYLDLTIFAKLDNNIGNIIDCMIYGLIFSDSMVQVATLFPEGGAYGTFLHGLVVDMFYFPLIEADFPEWLPIWGGEHFIFFSKTK